MGSLPVPFCGDLSSLMEIPNGEQGDKKKEQESSRDRDVGLHSKLCARGHWRPAEDAKLRELVSQHGPQNWNLIAEKLEGRSGKSCRLRWFNQLDPRINRRAFSEEEEEKLLAAHRAYGNKWALIARLFPGRTDNAVKNHWHVLMARKLREQQSNGYSKKKPPPSNNSSASDLRTLYPKCVVLNKSMIACSGESTITSTRDESASTSTDLSLSSYCSRAAPVFLNGCNKPTQQSYSLDLFMGPPGNDGYHGEKAGDSVAPVMLQVVAGADQSDSSSEASAAESVANISRPNPIFNGEHQDCEREKASLAFVDFLGVGAT